MKFKPLTEQQIIISIDRLTRFKPTEEKYVRVFRDIIVTNLIEPKFKKAELEGLDYITLRNYATEIFNASITEKNHTDFSINEKLQEYENSIFNNNDEINILLNNKLNYKAAIKLLANKSLAANQNILQLRKEKSLQYPISVVVIVEGITEEILLPEFATILGYDFLKYGIKVLPAGGKNQVVKLYYNLSQELKIPIFILLDKDAVDNVEAINKRLRTIDNVYLLNSGEFEDLLPKNFIVKTINSHLKNFASINLEDISKPEPMVKILEEIFKEKGLHEFKKAEFAHLVKSHILKNDVSEEITCIINGIKSISKTKSLI